MSKKKILKNASYLFVSDVLLRLVTALVTILIARYLGAHDYGIISIALAFAAIAGFFTDIGLTQTMTREATKPGANMSVLLSSYFRARMVMAFLTCLVSYILIEVMYEEEFVKSIVSWVVYPTIFGSALAGPGLAYYQVIEKMKMNAILRFTQGMFSAVTLLFAFFFKWPVQYVAPVYGFSYVVVGILTMVLVLREIRFFKGWDSEVIRGLSSFTITGLAVMIIPQLGPLILEKVASLKDVGFFSAAYRIPVLLYQVPGVIAVAFYPRLFSYANNNQFKEHNDLTGFQIKIMSLAVLLVSFPFFVYSDWVIELLFGDGWSKSAVAASILTFMVIFQAFERPLADHLTTIGKQNERTYIMIIGLMISIIVYYLLGKYFGVLGGALAAVISEFSLLIMFATRVKRGWSLLIKGTAINSLAYGATVILLLYVLNGLHPILGSIIGVVTFTLVVLLFDREIRAKAKNLKIFRN